MHYETYHYWGMHYIWWVIWVIILIWIFATPYHIPGQRKKKGTPLDILKNRFASGQMTKEEFVDAKKLID